MYVQVTKEKEQLHPDNLLTRSPKESKVIVASAAGNWTANHANRAFTAVHGSARSIF